MSTSIRITTTNHAIYQALIEPLSGTTDTMPMPPEPATISSPGLTVDWGKPTTRLGATETWFILAGQISSPIAASIVVKVIADWIASKIKELGRKGPDLKQHPLKISVESADGSATQIEVTGQGISEIKVKSTPPAK